MLGAERSGTLRPERSGSPPRRPRWSAARLGARLAFVAIALAATTPAAAAKKPLASGERIDLNRAGVVELMRLPGVGRAKAEAIAAQRARAHFRRVEDLLAVKGVSAAWIEKQQPHLVVGAPSSPARGQPVAKPSRPQPAPAHDK